MCVGGFKRCSQWTDALILGSLKTPTAASSCHCGEGRRMEFLFSAKTDRRRALDDCSIDLDFEFLQVFDVRVNTSSKGFKFLPVFEVRVQWTTCIYV